jgi:hypothetical protein
MLRDFWAGAAKLILLWFFVYAPTLASAADANQTLLEISSAQYFRSTEPYFRDGASASTMSWKLGFSGESAYRGFFGKAHLRNDYQAEEDHHYFKPFELAAGWRGDRAEVSLGRQLKPWSAMDSHWRIGLWQPRFQDDPLTREVGGLTGAFFQTKGSKLKFLAHASPMYLPELGPDAEIENRAFVSENPWFRPPTNLVNLRDNLTAVYYDLHKPPIEDIIFHGSGAVQLEYRPMATRFARVSAAYKPMNMLMYGFPIELHLQDPSYATVEVNPRVVYHQLLSLEGGIERENRLTTWWSLSHERPIRDETPAEWTTQEADDAVIGSAYLGYDIRGEGEYASHVFASYLLVQGGDAADGGDITGDGSFFERRYIFKDAAQVGFRHSAPWFSRKFLAKLTSTFTYDFAQHGIIFSTGLQQKLSKYWTMNINADFIGLSDLAGRVDDGFMSDYRANDRVSLGVQYVF